VKFAMVGSHHERTLCHGAKPTVSSPSTSAIHLRENGGSAAAISASSILAGDAEIFRASPEFSWKTGPRGRPSRDMVLKLAEAAGRCRYASANVLLVAAGVCSGVFHSARWMIPRLKSAAGLRSDLVLRAHEAQSGAGV